MSKINDGLTKSQRKTCAKIYIACKFGGWEKRRVTEATRGYFGNWIHARKLSCNLTEDQLTKFVFGG